ncbi:MAG: DUF1990 domain-containing protein [Planctomycetota bacterium]|nr:DUF1990 domain-containing protein [Planctomycetota bacterium]
MKSFRRPTSNAVLDWLEMLRTAHPTYDMRSSDVLPGFYEDHSRIKLGTGREIYESACQAIRTWRMFPAPMTRLVPALPPIVDGIVVSVLFRAGPLWTVNPCRIVDVIDQRLSGSDSFGFSYVTLPGHIECGHELFLVERDHADDSVYYSIRACSRPRWWPVWLVLPYARQQQRKFRRLSGESMLAAIKESGSQ